MRERSRDAATEEAWERTRRERTRDRSGATTGSGVIGGGGSRSPDLAWLRAPDGDDDDGGGRDWNDERARGGAVGARASRAAADDLLQAELRSEEGLGGARRHPAGGTEERGARRRLPRVVFQRILREQKRRAGSSHQWLSFEPRRCARDGEPARSLQIRTDLFSKSHPAMVCPKKVPPRLCLRQPSSINGWLATVRRRTTTTRSRQSAPHASCLRPGRSANARRPSRCTPSTRRPRRNSSSPQGDEARRHPQPCVPTIAFLKKCPARADPIVPRLSHLRPRSRFRADQAQGRR